MVRLIILLAFIIGGASASASIMEKMNKRPSFAKLARAKADAQHEVVIAVHQKNLPLLEAELLERSTPGTPKYQKWMSFEEVGTMIDTLESAVKIKSWLVESKIEVTWTSLRADYIKATAPISVWEKLLDTEFFEWEEHGNFKGTVVRSEQYSLPETMIPFIFAVFNTCQAMPLITKGALRKENGPYKSVMTVLDATKTPAASAPVTVQFINTYYEIPSTATGSATLTQSVFETSKESWSPNDLTQFQREYGLKVQTAQDIGGFMTNNCSTTGAGTDCFEGNLDVQYIMGVAQNTVTIYWYVAVTIRAQDPFVTYLTDIAASSKPSSVNSISWGSVEQLNPASSMTAFNNEAMKLGAIGVTVTVSSGDDGAAGSGARSCNTAKPASSSNCACDADSSSSGSSWSGVPWFGAGYFPSYPATAPFITSIGATQGPNDGLKEIICQSDLGGVITSGGGFSTFFAQPSWQNVSSPKYIAAAHPSAGFNPSGRGYPDISLIGVNYQTVVAGAIYGLFGTSASSPTFAAMISLVNAQREKNGLGTVGFINPSLYASANANKYIDVTSGKNNCAASSNPAAANCCASGFPATAGWDASTGFGAVTYPNLLAILGTV